MTTIFRNLYKTLFGTRQSVLITVSVSASFVVGIALYTNYIWDNNQNKKQLHYKYLPLYDPQQSTNDIIIKNEREKYNLMKDNPVFLHSKLKKKFLKEIKIKYINKEFMSKFEINDEEKYILQLCSNHEIYNKYSGASFYAGSTPQIRGNAAYVGTMGDGRVITIGQIYDINNMIWEIQLKGFGQTIIAKNMFKHKDGKFSLSEYKKEIECLVLLKKLNIPTYHIFGAVVLNGNINRKKKKKEPMIGLIRCANCWFRVGHFEYLYYSDKSNKNTMLWIINYVNHEIFDKDDDDKYDKEMYYDNKRLKEWMKARVMLKGDDLEIDEKNDGSNDLKIKYFLQNVIRLNAIMIAHWMFNGFVHGMMRSDNIHILGITFDLGSYKILDNSENDEVFDPNYQPGNVKMYAFNFQVESIASSMKRLAISLSMITKNINILQNELYRFWIIFWNYLIKLIQHKNNDNNNLTQFEKLLNSKQILLTNNCHKWLIEKYKLKDNIDDV